VIASDRGHGHFFYQEKSTGRRQILDNIGFNSFDVGMQAYGVTGPFVGGEIRGNIFFNSGAPGSTNGARNINLLVGTDKEPIPEVVIADNFFYQPPKSTSTNLSIGYGSTSNGAVVITGNYIAGALPVSILDWKKIAFQGNQLYSDGSWLAQISRVPADVQITWDGNAYLDNTAIQNCVGGNRRAPFVYSNLHGGCGPLDFSEWVRATGFDTTSAYTSGGQLPNAVFVRPNRYQAGRAHLVVFNWAQNDAVTVDLSSTGLVDRQSFTIVNAQNYFGRPVLEGVYDSSSKMVLLPMSSAAAQATAPVPGLPVSPPSTLPQFGAFVVVPGPLPPGVRGCTPGVTPCRPRWPPRRIGR